MTDREEREKVIEILQKEKKTALHDNRWAFDYAISSIKTDLKYDLLYEETSEQADKQADKPTTKDNLGVDYLGVDCISRQSVLDKIQRLIDAEQNNIDENGDYMNYARERINAYEAIQFFVENDCLCPSVTPQEPKTGHWIEEFVDTEGEVRFTCSCCGKYQLFGTDFCYHCGSDNREVEE